MLIFPVYNGTGYRKSSIKLPSLKKPPFQAQIGNKPPLLSPLSLVEVTY